MTSFFQFFDRILPTLEKRPFFLAICPYLAVLATSGMLEEYWKILERYWKNIEKLQDLTILKRYWKDIAKYEKYSKILKNIENIQETHWKIFVSWFSPHACNLEFEILAYMPVRPTKWSYAKWKRKYSRLGVQVIYIYNCIYIYIYKYIYIFI